MSNDLQTKLIVTAEDRGASTLLKRMGTEADMFVDKFSQIGSALTTAFGGITASMGIRKALSWVDDYRKSVLSVATTLTDTVTGDSKKIQDAFDQNMKHADRFFRMLQIQSKRSISSIDDLLNAYTIFTSKGVALTPTVKNAKMLADLVDRILLATKGQNSAMQVFQELRAVMNGTARPSDALAQIFRQRDPEYVKRLQKIYAEGGPNLGDNIMNYLSTLLSGLDLTQVMDKTLSYSFKRLKGNIQIWAIDAFTPLYDEITKVVKRLADYFEGGNKITRGLDAFIGRLKDAFTWGVKAFENFRQFLNTNSEISKTFKGILESLPRIVELLLVAKSAALALGFAHAAAAGTIAAAHTLPGGAILAAGAYLGAEKYATTNANRPYEKYANNEEVNVMFGDDEFKYGLRMVLSMIAAILTRLMDFVKAGLDFVKNFLRYMFDGFMVVFKAIEWGVRTLIEKLPGWMNIGRTRNVIENDIRNNLSKRYAATSFLANTKLLYKPNRQLESLAKWHDDNQIYAVMQVLNGGGTDAEKLDAIKQLDESYNRRRRDFLLRMTTGGYALRGDYNKNLNLNPAMDTSGDNSLMRLSRELQDASRGVGTLSDFVYGAVSNLKESENAANRSISNIVGEMGLDKTTAYYNDYLERMEMKLTNSRGASVYRPAEDLMLRKEAEKLEKARAEIAQAITGAKTTPMTNKKLSPVPYWNQIGKYSTTTAESSAEIAGKTKVFELEQNIYKLTQEISGVEATKEEQERRQKELLELTNQARIDALNATQQELEYQKQMNALREEGGIGSAGKAFLLKEAHTAKATFDLYTGFFDAAAKQMQNSLSDALYSVFTGDFKNLTDIFKNFVNGLLKAWTDMLAQMMMQWIVAKAVIGLGLGAASGGAINGVDYNYVSQPTMMVAANGNVFKGGFTPFASGGVVSSPTLGLVGEGRYNEAIVPLPDGRAIPVDMRGGKPNVTVNISDNSGNGNRYRTQESEDSEGNLIIDVIIDAMTRNRRGFRRNMQAMLAQPKGAT